MKILHLANCPLDSNHLFASHKRAQSLVDQMGLEGRFWEVENQLGAG